MPQQPVYEVKRARVVFFAAEEPGIACEPLGDFKCQYAWSKASLLRLGRVPYAPSKPYPILRRDDGMTSKRSLAEMLT